MAGDCHAAWPGFRLPLLLRRRSAVRTAAAVLVAACLAAVLAMPGAARAGGPQGQLTWGIHTTLAPTWFDPAETQGIITPYMVLYALHDALVKPMPGEPMGEDPPTTEAPAPSPTATTTRLRQLRQR